MDSLQLRLLLLTLEGPIWLMQTEQKHTRFTVIGEKSQTWQCYDDDVSITDKKSATAFSFVFQLKFIHSLHSTSDI